MCMRRNARPPRTQIQGAQRSAAVTSDIKQPQATSRAAFVADSIYSIYCITNNSGSCKWSPHHFLDVTFDFAVQAATIDATHLSDWPQAWAFDAAGNLLQVNQEITWHQQCGPSDHNNFCHQTVTVTPVTGQISRVIFSGLGGFVNLDKLTYTVP